MPYNFSEQELEELATMVPGWFVKALINGTDDDTLRAEVKTNLVSAHQLAGRPLPEDSILQGKVEDLFSLYKETVAEFGAKESHV